MRNSWRNALPCRSLQMVLLAIFLLTMTTGCGIFSTLTQTTKQIARESNESGQHLNKRVGIGTFGYGAFPVEYSLEQTFQASLTEKLRSECPEIILITQAIANDTDLMVSIPRHASGRINNYQLAKKARQFGLNAVITGLPIDVHEEVEEKGLLWFKGTHNYARLNASVDVYDTATGAKLLGENFIRKLEMDATSLDKVRQKRFSDLPALREMLEDVTDEAAEIICENIDVQKWSGYIQSVSGDQVSLSSGSSAGLIVGDILEVYGSRNTVKGVNNQEFYSPGKKIGEVRISTVTPDQSHATITSGDGIARDDLVTYKD